MEQIYQLGAGLQFDCDVDIQGHDLITFRSASAFPFKFQRLTDGNVTSHFPHRHQPLFVRRFE
jgi:hypothetical protein